MNALEQLLLRYSESPQVRRLVQALETLESPRFQLSGMSGSQECFVLSGLYRAQPGHHLFIADDKEEAAYIQNTLANLLEKKPVLFFPDSFKRPTNFEALNNINVLQRTETINKIATSAANGEIVVTYPEALFELVVSPEALEADRIDLTVKETVQVDTIFEVLLEYGFRREDFVYEPGQFSVRGGIVDIYTYGNEYPYRIELFDDQIESIRTFDPLTQLSVQNIGRVSIIPNINTKFSKGQKTALFEVLKPGTLIWVRDFQQIIERLQTCFEKAVEFRKTVSLIDESELAEIFRDGAFTTPAQVVAGIQRFPVLFLKTMPEGFRLSEKIIFHTGAQPAFNKHFDLLIKDLTKNTERRISNFIFTENPKQIERFYAIFEDLQANVQFQPITKAIHQGFIDEDLKVACYTDHQIFDRFHRYKLRQGFTRDVALNVKLLNELQPGDFVTHIDHGVGKFSGLEKININGHQQESVRLFYKNNDILYVSVHSLHKISRYVGKDGTEPQLSKLGSEAWKNLKNKTKKQVKDIAGELIKLYAKRRASQGYACAPDGYLQNEMEASFIYEDTPDQLKATNDVKEDMMKPYPMDRLICGDVGFGKTEVAIRAAFKAVTEGKQVAVLVPTTLLAHQHYDNFAERFAPFPTRVALLSRFQSPKDTKAIIKDTAAGLVDILIGTHRLLQKDVQFRNLGLVIIDEEQWFGVKHK
ncbi:MAG: DEAD/DEAH box helicase, partial [Saprospiraceae bacterium]|nr:DEAD/DEAH box helicase [Saprospiraceae bacterium]